MTDRTYRVQGRTAVPVRQQGLTPVLGDDGKWSYSANPDSSLLDKTKRELEAIRTDSDTARITAATALKDAREAGELAASKASMEDVTTEVGDQINGTFLIRTDSDDDLVVDSVSFFQDEDGWKMNLCVKRNSPFPGAAEFGFCGLVGYASLSQLSALETRVAELEAKLAGLQD